MPYLVYSNTGSEFPFFVEEGVSVSRSQPTKVDELTPAMEFQKANLRIVEVDEKGDPIEAPRQPEEDLPVDAKAYQTLAKERDELSAKLTEAIKDAEDALTEHKATVEFLEGFLPTSKSALGNLAFDDLKGLADYRKAKLPEGSDKAAYVAALAPKDEPK